MLSEDEKYRLNEKINFLHSDDQNQLEVIFSNSNRMLVEAPAGCGKTKTMISRIAYLLATNQVLNHKKILVLTFSMNATYKIKKDVAEQLPQLFQVNQTQSLKLTKKLFVSNYHGFCRRVLKLYGYLLHDNLKNIDAFTSIDDTEVQAITNNLKISTEKANFLSKFSNAVKEVNFEYVADNIDCYIQITLSDFLDKGYISFNAIILLVHLLFMRYKNVLKFYQDYFPLIIVDEFQDTNCLSWALLEQIIVDETHLLFMGDSLQRIYGFIGAIPNLMAKVRRRYNMKFITLEKNYRFKNNLNMLYLDRNIRLNAANPSNPTITNTANVKFCYSENQYQEAYAILNKLTLLTKADQEVDSKIAILVKQRGANVDEITTLLSKHKISYFYGLFSDNDTNYLRFHRECYSQFVNHLRISDKISKLNLKRFYQQVESTFRESKNDLTISALLELLRVFLNRVLTEYSFLQYEEKMTLIKENFENNTLKQTMEYVDKKIILSTIHGAKGLEWDYVLIPDMEQYSMPNWHGLCGICNHKNLCNLKITDINLEKFLAELSVFYVGVTRARKQVFFSASKTRLSFEKQEKPANISCLLKLPGIDLISEDWKL